MNWERRGDAQHCNRHNLTFGLKGSCLLCLNDAGKPPTADIEQPLPEAPPECHSSVEHEQWFTTLAKDARTLAFELTKGEVKHRPECSTAAKLLDVAIKAMRAAADLTTTRERREWVKHMAREARKLRAGARR